MNGFSFVSGPAMNFGTFPNISNLFDMNFFWEVVRNFIASYGPFVMILLAVVMAGMIARLITRSVRSDRE